jgi:hypothetical protein
MARALGERASVSQTVVGRAIRRGQLPRGTDGRLMVDMIKSVIDDRFGGSSGQLDEELLARAVCTIVAGARTGTLVGRRRRLGAGR